MIVQHTSSITVAEAETIDSVSENSIVFRSKISVGKNTSQSGQSAYLTFSANQTKTIDVPIGYTSDKRIKLIGECNGTLEVNVTHPINGSQKLILKNGSLIFSMRMTGITIIEMAGSSAWFKWSMMQIDDINSEDFT
jgi:hypothetical protein